MPADKKEGETSRPLQQPTRRIFRLAFELEGGKEPI